MIEKIKDCGFGVISVEKELTNEEFLSKLYEADNKMQINSLEGFEKLRQENRTLRNYIDKSIEWMSIMLNWSFERVNKLINDFIERKDNNGKNDRNYTNKR